MGIMIPSVISQDTLSQWERRLFESFRCDLSDDYYVIHSLGCVSHPQKLWAEGDFVIISEKGIFVIEVKGGGVSCKDGVWTYTSRDGKVHKGHEGPWEQAKEIMFAIRNKIETDERNRGFAYGYGVITPDESFKVSGMEIKYEVLLHKDNWNGNLKFYLQGLEDHWYEKNRLATGKKPRLLDKQEREFIRKQLRPDFPSAYTLKSKFGNIEQHLIELTEEQSRIMQGIKKNPRTIIEGGAGTGKTILAMEKAKMLAKEGKQVLFLCYNHLLADTLIENVPEDETIQENLSINACHRYMREVVAELGFSNELNSKDPNDQSFYNVLMPEVYCNAILSTRNFQEFDVIIIDEAQDLLTPQILDAIDLTIKGSLKDGNWHLFLDPLQDIYSKNSIAARDRLNSFSPTNYELTTNCRNCHEVAESTSEISLIDVPSEGAVKGGDAKQIFYKNVKDFKNKFESEIKSLFAGGLNTADFIILSTRKYENSVVSNIDDLNGYVVKDIRFKNLISLSDNTETDQNYIDFCTMHAFKGLERKAVIAVDVETPTNDYNQKLLYSGLSRAKYYLTVFISKQN